MPKDLPWEHPRDNTHTMPGHHTHTHTVCMHRAGRENPDVTVSLTPGSRQLSWRERGQAIKLFPQLPPCNSSTLFIPSIPTSSPHCSSVRLEEKKLQIIQGSHSKIMTQQNSALQPLFCTQQAPRERPLLFMHNLNAIFKADKVSARHGEAGK